MKSSLPKEPVAPTLNVLLVEDSAFQAMMFQRSIAEMPQLNLLDIASDGVEALDYLRRAGAYENAPRPDLVLLDINMPRKDGFQVLEEMKSDPQLRSIPVVLFSTSDHADDIAQGYARGANAFLPKSLDVVKLTSQMTALVRYWTQVALLPNRARIAG